MIEQLKDRDRVPGKLYILMAKPPGPDSEFIEVEDSECFSVSFGRWVRLGDYYALEIDDPR